jgi:hypothetical protein
LEFLLGWQGSFGTEKKMQMQRQGKIYPENKLEHGAGDE